MEQQEPTYDKRLKAVKARLEAYKTADLVVSFDAARMQLYANAPADLEWLIMEVEQLRHQLDQASEAYYFQS